LISQLAVLDKNCKKAVQGMRGGNNETTVILLYGLATATTTLS